MNGEFNALEPGLAEGIPKRNSRFAMADRELDASAIHGQLGAQVALLQSPILPIATKTSGKRSKMQCGKNKKLLPMSPGETVTYVSELTEFGRFLTINRPPPAGGCPAIISPGYRTAHHLNQTPHDLYVPGVEQPVLEL